MKGVDAFGLHLALGSITECQKTLGRIFPPTAVTRAEPNTIKSARTLDEVATLIFQQEHQAWMDDGNQGKESR